MKYVLISAAVAGGVAYVAYKFYWALAAWG